MSQSVDILGAWSYWHPKIPAVGFLVPDEYPHRWLRIHSLPESKRYTDSDHEHAELLHRHNTVATDVLGSTSRCAVIVCAPCDMTPEVIGRRAALRPDIVQRMGPLPADLHDEETGVFASPMCLYGCVLDWSPGILDGLIRAVTDDQLRALVFSLENGSIYAPYNGGADLIFTSPAERDRASGRYSAWLSSHPAGL